MAAAPVKTNEQFDAHMERFIENKPVADLYGVNETHFARYEYQAYQCYTQGRLEDTEVIVNGIIALDATRPYPYMLRGDIALQRVELDAAIEAFTTAKANETKENRTAATVKLGEALLKARKVDEAEAELNEVMSTTPESHPHHQRAISLKRVLEAFRN